MSLVIYFIFALAFLAALASMIVQISRRMGDCPDKGPIARAAGVTIATGYTAIGGGAVALIGSGLPIIDGGTPATLFAIGFAALVLGLGFTHAVTTLRLTVQPLQAGGLVNAPQVAAPVAVEQI